MSLFTDASIEAILERRYGYSRPWPGRRASIHADLEAAVAALDETELIEKAAKAIHGGAGCTCRHGARGDARATLTAIGLLP